MRNALLGRYDVLLTHWPERAVERPGALRSMVGGCVLLLLAVSARLRGRQLVQFVHNLRSHDGPHARLERAVLGSLDRLTTGTIHLSKVSASLCATKRPGLRNARSLIVRHGQDCAFLPMHERLGRARLLAFGAIKPYKNLDRIIEAASTSTRPCSLRIVGHAAEPEIEADLRELARSADGVEVVLGHLSDQDLDEELATCDLVVIGHDRFLNSGSILYALSRRRRVLAPAVGSVPEIAADVGPGWIVTYEPPLDAAALDAAMSSVDEQVDPPQLEDYRWAVVGPEIAAFVASLVEA